MTNTLTVIGTGIKFLSHITVETKAYIENADKVLFLLNEPAIAEWIKNKNPSYESLEELYFSCNARRDSYTKITNYILETLKHIKHLCVAFYGHPTIFADPALEAAKIAKSQGYDVRILPGISAEDCLFADLFINPGQRGCQSYEATDLVENQKRIDNRSHLIIWQPDCIYEFRHKKKAGQENLNLLIMYLANYYDLSHEVCIYEAAQYPHLNPKIVQTPLEKLTPSLLSSISTLYIKPISE